MQKPPQTKNNKKKVEVHGKEEVQEGEDNQGTLGIAIVGINRIIEVTVKAVITQEKE